MYKLILDRLVGQHELHPLCFIAGAGNLITDNAVVEPMSTAMQSRLGHIQLSLDVKEFMAYALKEQFDHRVISYLYFKPENLYTFHPDHTDCTYACPRTWDKADKVLKAITVSGASKEVLTNALQGVIGMGVGIEFSQYLDIYKELITLPEILANPASVPVPKDIGTIYAIIGLLASGITHDTADQIITFLDRLPSEFQMIGMKQIIFRDASLTRQKAVSDWIAKSSDKFF